MVDDGMIDDSERSAEARSLAETALAWLLVELDDPDLFIVVLGGLVPEVLTRGQEPPVIPHLGTADVDVLLITHVHADRDYGAVERALGRMDFEPFEEDWRWRGRVGDRPVILEFLCDLDDHPEGEVIRPAGCEVLSAANLRGTGYVALDFTWEEIEATLPNGRTVRVRARFAGLEGYLLSKCVAARTRAADKDYYDLPYVLLHNRAGGPAAAAQQLRDGRLAEHLSGLRSTFIELRERYRRTSDRGPACYAEQMQLVEPNADAALLRADAVAAVQEFLDVLAIDR
jgi:hypothetical protein